MAGRDRLPKRLGVKDVLAKIWADDTQCDLLESSSECSDSDSVVEGAEQVIDFSESGQKTFPPAAQSTQRSHLQQQQQQCAFDSSDESLHSDDEVSISGKKHI